MGATKTMDKLYSLLERNNVRHGRIYDPDATKRPIAKPDKIVTKPNTTVPCEEDQGKLPENA